MRRAGLHPLRSSAANCAYAASPMGSVVSACGCPCAAALPPAAKDKSVAINAIARRSIVCQQASGNAQLVAAERRI